MVSTIENDAANVTVPAVSTNKGEYTPDDADVFNVPPDDTKVYLM